MGIWDWKYTASDLADWFDEQDEKYWKRHDEWLLDSQQRGDASPVLLFASWVNDRASTAPQRVASVAAGGIIDVLRLGNDFDLNSGWGIAKGVFLNLTRVATVAGPLVGEAAEAAGVTARYAGITATSKLKNISGLSPCTLVNTNNVLSYLAGKPVQIFGLLEDVVKGAGNRELLLSEPNVQAVIQEFGITWERLGGMKTVEDVLSAAKSSEGPISFGVRWINALGKGEGHALMAARDGDGVVRILDYVPKGGQGTFKGFASLAELLKARPHWGPGFAKATLIAENPVLAFSSRYLKLLSFADGTASLAIPVAMGMKWLRGAGPEEKIFEIIRSVWRYVKSGDPALAPPPQPPSVLPRIPENVKSVPAAPDHQGRRLGVRPLAPEAARAPRIDWLTGVQYRLRYLGYYNGAVNGVNDSRTKSAVLEFQKSWFDSSRQWDGVPGPATQAAIFAAIGW
jgi:hypothetical protein